MKKNTTPNTLFITGLTLIALTLSLSANAKIYKWTDTNGLVHYSAQPPKQNNDKIKAENIEEHIRNKAGKYRPTTADKATKPKASDETAAALEGPSKELLQYCQNQKNTLVQLKKNFRNVWIDAEGNRTILNQKQRQEKVNKIAGQIKTECAEVKPNNKA